MTEQKSELLKLDETWTKNTSTKLFGIYIELLQCLKYGSTEEAFYRAQDLKLEDPMLWLSWVDNQFNTEHKDNRDSSNDRDSTNDREDDIWQEIRNNDDGKVDTIYQGRQVRDIEGCTSECGYCGSCVYN
jgi:hypothetical protein